MVGRISEGGRVFGEGKECCCCCYGGMDEVAGRSVCGVRAGCRCESVGGCVG
jgi:hypothetical protein